MESYDDDNTNEALLKNSRKPIDADCHESMDKIQTFVSCGVLSIVNVNYEIPGSKISFFPSSSNAVGFITTRTGGSRSGTSLMMRIGSETQNTGSSLTVAAIR